MREIKFRAWDKNKLEMVYMSFLTIHEWRLSANYKENGDYTDLMQYTGLKDKNGVEIYEGDIVKAKIKSHGEVVSYVKYYQEYGMFAVADTPHYYVSKHMVEDRPMGSSGSSTSYKPYTPKSYLWIEVIGNVYENPNLIS